MKLLTAAEILGAQDVEHEDVEVPEWGAAVRVQAMTAAQRLAYEQAGRVLTRDDQGRPSGFEWNPDWDNRTVLVICSVVDEEGNPLFTMDQLEALQRKSAAPLQRIADVAARLSGLRASDAQTGTARLKGTTDGESPSTSA